MKKYWPPNCPKFLDLYASINGNYLVKQFININLSCDISDNICLLQDFLAIFHCSFFPKFAFGILRLSWQFSVLSSWNHNMLTTLNKSILNQKSLGCLIFFIIIINTFYWVHNKFVPIQSVHKYWPKRNTIVVAVNGSKNCGEKLYCFKRLARQYLITLMVGGQIVYS